jgi:SOS-response transcriptional repressor LexA
MNYVYAEWLDGFVKKVQPTNLRDSTKNMVERMRAALRYERTEEAWNLLERLKRFNEGFDAETRIEKYKHEKPESYMECALIAYELGYLRDALELFQIAIGYFHNSTYKAVCYWMAGCVQWQLPARAESAVLSWERSLQLMDDFIPDNLGYATDPTLKEKYKNAVENMKDAIDKATRHGYPHPPPNMPAETKINQSAYSARLKFNSLPYYGSIPAGDPVAALSHSDGEIEMESLEIEGNSYNVFNIKNEGEVELKPSAEYFLMKVVGNSMNIATPVKIENGDYVLLKNTRLATNNDIVAAAVIGKGEPDVATLKRYSTDDSGYYLDSESNLETIHIDMSDADYIQGVVVAILKPADD